MSVAPVRVWGISLSCFQCLLDVTKTSKKQHGQERTTVRCHLDASFKFKMVADKQSKKFLWLMISIYEICKSHAKSFARIESAWCVWKKYYSVKTALQWRVFWNTRIRWGWSATVTEGRAHFFFFPYWLVWDCVWDWVGVVLKCTMGLFRWTDFAHVSRATP